MSKKNPYAPKTLDTVKSTNRVVSRKTDTSVVDGTIKEILEWVGDDKVKAQKALDAENSRDSARSTLVKNLTAVLESNEDN